MRRRIVDSNAHSVGRIIGGVVALVLGMAWISGTGSIGMPMVPYFGYLICFAGLFGIFAGLFNISVSPEDRIGSTEIVDIEDKIYCKNCGKSIPDDSTFCKFCGIKQ